MAASQFCHLRRHARRAGTTILPQQCRLSFHIAGDLPLNTSTSADDHDYREDDYLMGQRD
jgi:hypothetical protein